MSLRHSAVSRVERVMSVVTAIGATVLAGLAMMLAPGRGFLAAFSPRPAPSRASDRVVYVVPATVVKQRPTIVRSVVGAAATASRSTVLPPTTASAQVVESNAVPLDTAASRPNSARVDPTASPTKPTTATRAAAGAPAASAAVAFSRPSEPTRFDSAIADVNRKFKEGLASGLLQPPPPTQDEIDAKLRAQAFEAIAARGAGVPVPRVMVGASIPVGLPLGGPSNKQRARDRALFEALQKTVALRQQKAESIAAVRKRRVDSLAQLADSGRRRQNQNY